MNHPYQIVCEAISLNEMIISDPAAIKYYLNPKWAHHLEALKGKARQLGHKVLVVGPKMFAV